MQKIYSLSDVSKMLLILLISRVLQGSNGSGGDWTPPSGATLSVVWREISEGAWGADFPRRCFVVASSSLDSSGDILHNDKVKSSKVLTTLKLKILYLLFLLPRYPFLDFFFDLACSDVDSLSAELLLEIFKTRHDVILISTLKRLRVSRMRKPELQS